MICSGGRGFEPYRVRYFLFLRVGPFPFLSYHLGCLDSTSNYYIKPLFYVSSFLLSISLLLVSVVVPPPLNLSVCLFVSPSLCLASSFYFFNPTYCCSFTIKLKTNLRRCLFRENLEESQPLSFASRESVGATDV